MVITRGFTVLLIGAIGFGVGGSAEFLRVAAVIAEEATLPVGTVAPGVANGAETTGLKVGADFGPVASAAGAGDAFPIAGFMVPPSKRVGMVMTGGFTVLFIGAMGVGVGGGV